MVVMMARTLDIKGYVQNLPNGKVFIIAEGPREDLARFVKSIRIDNSRIRVDEIFIDCKDAKGEFNNFYKLDSNASEQDADGHGFPKPKRTISDCKRQISAGILRAGKNRH